VVLFIEGRVLAHAWGGIYLVLALDSWMSIEFVEICVGSDLGKSSFGSSG
jgi:drug/metabolite transporter superfamily protein YnfA